MTGPGSPDEQPQAPASPPPVSAPPSPAASWAAATAPVPIPGREGFFYADVPNRAIAYIIDVIILAVISLVVGIVLDGIGLNPVTINLNSNGFITYNYFAGIIQAIVFAAISGGYFIYTWTTMRASPGQRALGMQVGQPDGATITMEQAVRRWLALGAPFGIAQALSPISGLGILIGLAAFVWFIALLVTTAQSPTKQGLHDQFAGTVVVKAARSVA